MDKFLTKDFLLNTSAAKKLYHEHAAELPIIDYHSHLPPKKIADDHQFSNITNLWLDGDHYKWRAMRIFGIDEKYITGEAGNKEKFQKWAHTVPYTMRNPLYHWSCMELKDYFSIEEPLNFNNAEAIYDLCNQQLTQPEFSAKNLLLKKKVEVVCTTDDPVDSLSYHQDIKNQDFEIKVLPTFRPDNAYSFNNPQSYNSYLDELEIASGIKIITFDDLMTALEVRIDYFDQKGCKLSDHGMERVCYKPTSKDSLERHFKTIRQGNPLDEDKQHCLRYHILLELGRMYHKRCWIQQFHLGALRNANTRKFNDLGPASGFDSIGDSNQSRLLADFLNELDKSNQLPKTILYNLNPADNAVMASMTGNFNDGSEKGKVQYGTAWWFNDQKQGMEEQINILSNMSLLSCFIGMLTDSRSFLSYPRHDYFRRILCNLIGNDVENGELPNDLDWLGTMVSNICYYNAKSYFRF